MQNFIITRSGQELMAGMMEGTSSCSFTKVAVSCHDYSGGDLESLMELQDVRQEAVPSEISRTDGATVKIIAAINNARLDEGYYVRAVGLFARDSDGGEILYAVSIETDHPDYLPAFKGKTVSSITYSMNIRAGNSSRVVLEVSSAAVPTIEQVKNMRRDIDTHGGLSVYTEEGTHGIRYSGGTLSAKNPDTGEWEDVQAEGLAELNRLKADKESPEFTGEPKAPTPPQSSNGARVATTAFVNARVSGHDTSTSAHDDIRSLISGLAARLNALADSDDTTLDQLSEIVAYIRNNKSLIDGVTTSKVSVSDIIDSLTSTATNKPLSAKQGKTLKDLIDVLATTAGNKVDKVSGKGLSANDFTDAEKSKLAGVAANANNYSLPLSSSSARGGAKIGYSQNGKNYPVSLSDEKMYVNVPWTDNNTWKPNTKDSEGYVTKGSGQANKVWKTDANGNPGWRDDANTTYGTATQSANGLMSAADKKKLDGMSTGATKSPISSSSDIASTGLYALDATEKNASIPGTMAHAIAQAGANSFLKSKIKYGQTVQNITNGWMVIQHNYGAKPSAAFIFGANEPVIGIWNYDTEGGGTMASSFRILKPDGTGFSGAVRLSYLFLWD